MVLTTFNDIEKYIKILSLKEPCMQLFYIMDDLRSCRLDLIIGDRYFLDNYWGLLSSLDGTAQFLVFPSHELQDLRNEFGRNDNAIKSA